LREASGSTFFGFYPYASPVNVVVSSYSVNKPGVNGSGYRVGSKWGGKFFAEAHNRIFIGDRHAVYRFSASAKHPTATVRNRADRLSAPCDTCHLSPRGPGVTEQVLISHLAGDLSANLVKIARPAYGKVASPAFQRDFIQQFGSVSFFAAAFVSGNGVEDPHRVHLDIGLDQRRSKLSHVPAAEVISSIGENDEGLPLVPGVFHLADCQVNRV
jgi:hypothetical protein